jgi:hypothetical protein
MHTESVPILTCVPNFHDFPPYPINDKDFSHNYQ